MVAEYVLRNAVAGSEILIADIPVHGLRAQLTYNFEPRRYLPEINNTFLFIPSDISIRDGDKDEFLLRIVCEIERPLCFVEIQ